jgi:transposase
MRRLEISGKEALLALLKASVHESDEAAFLHRMHCLVLIAEGFGCYEVARWFGNSPRTLERWIHSYERFGCEGLKEDKKPGPLGRLDFDQIQALRRDIESAPRRFGYSAAAWNGHLLTDHIRRIYGVELGSRQCQRLLAQLRSV